MNNRLDDLVALDVEKVANHTATALGVVRPSIVRYWDNDDKSSVHILEASDRPQRGVTSFATIGLSDYPLMLKGQEFGVRAEIIGVCGSAFPGFANVIATAAFCVMNSAWFCAPGIIFPDVVSVHNASVTMSDIYFAHPFLWERELAPTAIEGRPVAWLLAVPVSKEESAFAQSYGPERLEALFAEKDIDIFNLNRASVV